MTAVLRARHRLARIEAAAADGATTLAVAADLGWLPRQVHRYLERHKRRDIAAQLSRNDARKDTYR
ncbi:hypothetical protein GCM10025864_44830 [Luteimicrobium album]|uniref:Helix-turn-helix domain-containing protein n=1 Tax=Luteimicrobium album TaxID=1054550 RepID=A0ABQ6HV32_9MICO|nr:hypothetical protein [Luteimicrobium album]GMA22257.1 hypothetical protein GCM10025864_00160 [Luteimicrobium album]GMA26662.1 hypothetical protein GCM10025864_44210 [Luteimicrobium album]GMA26724.1 hypothetical protein GCM10025864_44830 [Luteimicrobium album]